MSITMYAHPFSSYCQKVLIALYENDIAFEWRLLAGDERIAKEHAALWPLKRSELSTRRAGSGLNRSREDLTPRSLRRHVGLIL